MSHRVNVILEDQVWESLQELPRGERSRFISRAIEERILREKRVKAAAEMDKIRQNLPPLDDSIDIVDMIRQDRSRDD